MSGKEHFLRNPQQTNAQGFRPSLAIQETGKCRIFICVQSQVLLSKKEGRTGHHSVCLSVYLLTYLPSSIYHLYREIYILQLNSKKPKQPD